MKFEPSEFLVGFVHVNVADAVVTDDCEELELEELELEVLEDDEDEDIDELEDDTELEDEAELDDMAELDDDAELEDDAELDDTDELEDIAEPDGTDESAAALLSAEFPPLQATRPRVQRHSTPERIPIVRNAEIMA